MRSHTLSLFAIAALAMLIAMPVHAEDKAPLTDWTESSEPRAELPSKENDNVQRNRRQLPVDQGVSSLLDIVRRGR